MSLKISIESLKHEHEYILGLESLLPIQHFSSDTSYFVPVKHVVNCTLPIYFHHTTIQQTSMQHTQKAKDVQGLSK